MQKFLVLAMSLMTMIVLGCGGTSNKVAAPAKPQKTVQLAAAASLEKVFEQQLIPMFNKKHPEIDLSQYTLYRDIALHMDLDNDKVNYSVAIILWIENEQGEEIHVEFYDPFEVEINAEDNSYLKKLVLKKLVDSFF